MSASKYAHSVLLRKMKHLNWYKSTLTPTKEHTHTETRMQTANKWNKKALQKQNTH